MLGSSVAQSIVVKVQLGAVAFVYGPYFSICSPFYAFNSIGTIGYEVSGFVVSEEKLKALVELSGRAAAFI